MAYRDTSAIAYDEITKNGRLGKAQLRVYEFIYKYGPCTINAIIENLSSPGQNTGVFTGRMSELHEMRVIRVIGETEGPTGHKVKLWDVTSSLPMKREKREAKNEQIKRLTARVAELEAKLGLPFSRPVV